MVKRALNIFLLAIKMLKKIRPLWTFLPKVSTYRKDFDETKYILTKNDELIKNDELLEKYK